jgi:hypothetical protein
MPHPKFVDLLKLHLKCAKNVRPWHIGTKVARLEEDPEITYSPFCAKYEKDGRTVEVSIFRVEPETTWHLEVINEMNTSTVWDDPFDTDADAFAEFMATVEEEGMGAFEDVPRVVH